MRAFSRAALLKLLRDEYALRRGRVPWKCPSENCPYRGQPMTRTCGCFLDFRLEHERRVQEALDSRGESCRST